MTEYNKLINDINNGKLSPVYLIHGDENYFKDNIIKNITDSIINETSADFDLKKIYGKKTDETQENEVIDFVKRFPLSGDYNLLIVKDSKNLSDDFKNIISYIENINSKTILVLSFDKSIDKRKKIYKSCLKHGSVYESKKIYENQVYGWIQEQCKFKSLNLHPNSIKIIENFSGNDLLQIDNELEKLKLNSSKDDIIKPEDVEDIIGFSKEYNFFELTKSAVIAAMHAADENSNELERLSSLAKFQAGETLHLVSNEAIQMHGGIGVTDEYDIGFYLKRARVAEQIFGTSEFHQARYADISGF